MQEEYEPYLGIGGRGLEWVWWEGTPIAGADIGVGYP